MPTAVLIHGAWHGAWCWDLVADALRERDIAVLAPELPLTGLVADAAVARAAITSADDDVVVCGHSYGGLVISDAARRLPNVRRLVYLAALMTEEGERVIDLLAAHPTPLLESMRATDAGIEVDPARAHEVFYRDSDAAVAAACAARLRPMPTDPDTAVTPPDPAWRSTPATYVVCTADRAVAPELQRTMAARADRQVEWPTDHSPFLTRPDDVAELIAASFEAPGI